MFSVNIDDPEQRRRRQQQQEKKHLEGQQKLPSGKRATDDYHYDKFKKQFRRY